MQNQPVMSMELVAFRHDALEPGLDLEGVAARRKARAVGDPEDMGVDRDRRLLEGDIENDIGRLPSDTGERLQRLAAHRNLATMLGDELLRQGDQVPRLAPIE